MDPLKVRGLIGVILLAVCASLVVGCINLPGKSRPIGRVPHMPRWYKELEGMPSPQLSQRKNGKNLSIVMQGLPLADCCRLLSREAGVSLVVSEALDEKIVNLEVKDQPVEEVISVLSRRVGAQLTRVGEVYYLGDLRPEDRALLVARVRRLEADQINEAVQSLLSDLGRCTVQSDGLTVVADRVEILQRVESMIRQIEASPSVTWVVQFHLLSVRDDAVNELGLDVVPALELSAKLAALSSSSGASGAVTSAAAAAAAAASSTPQKSGADLTGGLDAMLKASATSDVVEVMAEPLLLCVDGSVGTWKRGERIPVPNRIVSQGNGGVTTTTGSYQYIQTGFDMECTVRELSESMARAKIRMDLSSLNGFVDVAPRTLNEGFKLETDIRSGGVYLIAALRGREDKKNLGTWLKIGKRDNLSGRLIVVWCRTYRVAAPVHLEGQGVGGAVSTQGKTDGANQNDPQEKKNPDDVPIDPGFAPEPTATRNVLGRSRPRFHLVAAESRLRVVCSAC